MAQDIAYLRTAYLRNSYWRNPERLVHGDYYDYALFFHCYRQDEWDIHREVIDEHRDRTYVPGQEDSPKLEARQEDIPGRPRPPEPPTEAQKDFLKSPPVEANGWYKSMGWKGFKILGQGGNGLAGLFTRTDEDGKEHRIVIKSDIHGNTLEDEAKIMLMLRRDNPRSRHIVNFLKNPGNPEEPTKDEDLLDENLKRWRNYIAIEVCDNGDLQDKLKRCRENRTPLTEKELWSIFSCLLKAITVLHNGTEDPSSESLLKWPICHFDIKPNNIFIGDNDNNHVESLIYKLGDYGLAKEMQVSKWDRTRKHNFRRMATFGYYAPEQFSERWDFKDRYLDNDIVGNYGTHTNIWWIAAVMWQLVLLTGPPPPKGFIVPGNVSEDLHKRGTTYGSRILRPGGYSDTLKHLILQCLCESPSQRPNIWDLHERVRQGRQTCQNPAVPAADYVAGVHEPGAHTAGPLDFWFTPKPPPAFVDLTSDTPSLSALIARFEQAVQDIENGKADDLKQWKPNFEACLNQARDPFFNAEDLFELREIMIETAEEAHMPLFLKHRSVSRNVSALIAEIAQEQATQGAGSPSPTQREPANGRQVETDEPSHHTPLSKQRRKRKRSPTDDDVGIDVNAGKRKRIKSPDIAILNDAGEWEALESASPNENTEGGQDAGDVGKDQVAGAVEGVQDAEDVGKDQVSGAVEAGNSNKDEAEDVNRDRVEDDLPDYVSD